MKSVQNMEAISSRSACGLLKRAKTSVIPYRLANSRAPASARIRAVFFLFGEGTWVSCFCIERIPFCAFRCRRGCIRKAWCNLVRNKYTRNRKRKQSVFPSAVLDFCVYPGRGGSRLQGILPLPAFLQTFLENIS